MKIELLKKRAGLIAQVTGRPIGSIRQKGTLGIESGSRTYGRLWRLVETVNDYGGVASLLSAQTAQELYDLMGAYLDGIYSVKKLSNPSSHSVHTSKWDRCVHDVKARGGNYDPYAVCTSSLGYKKSIKTKHRRQNPTKRDYEQVGKADEIVKLYGYRISGTGNIIFPSGKNSNLYVQPAKDHIKIRDINDVVYWSGVPEHIGDFLEKFWYAKKLPISKNPINGFLLSVKNTSTGQRAYYTGEEPDAFDSNKSRGKIYATAAHARAASLLLQRNKRLKPGWRYAVVIASHVNPAGMSAEKLYTDFHGEPPRSVKERVLPQFSKGLEIGPVAAITYDTTRDGKRIRFEHEFSKRAAPLLITNGRTLALTGGRYRFTERGIVDREK